MGVYVFALKDYIESDTYDRLYIVDDRIRDKEFRRKLIRDSLLEGIVDETEKCIADKSRIIRDKVEKVYRERLYEVGNMGNGFCYTSDSGLKEYIYYSSSIPYIYHLKYLEFINDYKDEERLSVLNLIYPAKMPTKDYFPFIEFDLYTKIPLILTEEEKQRYKEDLDDFSVEDIIDIDWCYCILWIDKDRMFMNLLNEAYYFKQVGKNVHLFKLIIPL